MQISRQSADSQQASMMPQSMSQGRSQSAHSPEPQQQQQMQESSELQEPQVAQSSMMLQRVRNSQKRQERIQWTQQSAIRKRQDYQKQATDSQAREAEIGQDGWIKIRRKKKWKTTFCTARAQQDAAKASLWSSMDAKKSTNVQTNQLHTSIWKLLGPALGDFVNTLQMQVNGWMGLIIQNSCFHGSG